MSETIHILKWSGGLNSSVMVDEWLNRGNPVDYIICNDTGYEFDAMYQYWDVFSDYLESKHGIRPIVNNQENAKKLFDKWMFGKYQRGAMQGRVRGWPKVSVPVPWCRRELKLNATDKWVKENIGDSNIEYYIGYTKDEANRMINKPGFSYPLPFWGYGSDDCLHHLMINDIWHPLYDYFDRTGCFLCPFQSKSSFRTIRDHFPKEWAEIKSIEARLIEMDAANTEIKPGYTTTLMELEWAENDKSEANQQEQYKLFGT